MEAKISDYLDGTLSKSEVAAFERQLSADDDFRKEVEEFKILFEAIKTEETVAPSKRLATNFERMLQEEKNNQVKVISLPSKPSKGIAQVFRVAASIAILVGSFFMGRYFESRETQETMALVQGEQLELKQTTMISLMENQSASKRIQGVQFIDEFPEPDEAIVEALAERMLTDDNTNVRLTAVEALSRFTQSEQVKAFFIQALQTEKDPSIQVTLIKILVDMQEKKAIAPMRELLEKEDTQPFIKEEINSLLPKII